MKEENGVTYSGIHCFIAYKSVDTICTLSIKVYVVVEIEMLKFKKKSKNLSLNISLTEIAAIYVIL